MIRHIKKYNQDIVFFGQMRIWRQFEKFEDTKIYNSHGIVCADLTAGGTAEMPLPAEILRHNKRIVPCGCSWSMVI
ncbi:MAG: hypothetical protein IJZ64_04415 [Ruminococcus sp.]|nr:hypothetical protein [Ruminococcus sp.]